MKVERLRPSTAVSTWMNNPGPRIKYETLNFVLSGNLVAYGNGTDNVSIFKMTGSDAWDNQAYIANGFTAPVTLEFNKSSAYQDNGRSYAMMGWNADPTTNASWTSLDHTSYPYRSINYRTAHNGTETDRNIAWNPGDRFYIVYDTDGFIKHYNGSRLLHSVSYGIGNTVYLDSSFYSPRASTGGFSNIRVTKNSWNGLGYGVTAQLPTAGLQLNLNAYDTASYPGTGTTWFDISGNGKNFTWNTTPSYTSGSAAYFSTAGKGANGPASNTFNISNSSGYTVMVLCLQNSLTTNAAFKFYGDTTNTRGIFAHLAWTDGIVYFDQGGNRVQVSSGGTNAWNLWTFRRSVGTYASLDIIKNNTILVTGRTQIGTSALNATAAQIADSNSEVKNWDARLGAFLTYNRPLSNLEVDNVYNFYKTRYGLA
jgi:hypothetical protein